jgi:peptide deformylase
MPKILPILLYPNKKLRQKSTNLNKSILKKPEFKQFLADMSVTMLKNDGAGLAAPQVGKNIRLAVINTKDGLLYLINPIITKKSWQKETDQEGCLSIPNIYGQVKRHKKITCEYLDSEGKAKIIDAKGLLARVIQHEHDHLDGILFIDKATKLETTK